MSRFRCAVLVLLCAAATPWAASAADIVLDGEAACLAIGGAWRSGTCVVHRLVVPADTRLLTVIGVTLASEEVVNDGYLEIQGGLEATGTLLNRGTFVTRAYIVSEAQILNEGSWLNQGTFQADATVVNDWYFDNRGMFQTRTGTFINRGYMVIFEGQFWNSGGRMVNEGYIFNAGYLFNPAGSILDNAGVITTYDATFFNDGRAIGRCGSAYYVEFPGAHVGNPVEYEPCTSVDAATVLGHYVLGLGQRMVLEKLDAIRLSRMAFKASKRLGMGREAEAVELLEMLVAEVPGPVESPIHQVLVRRASRVLQLAGSPW